VIVMIVHNNDHCHQWVPLKVIESMKIGVDFG
jgi:hypothetical protein